MMKRKITPITILFFVCVMVFTGCRTISYTPALPIPNKIPALLPLIDNTDVELVYGQQLNAVSIDSDVANHVNDCKITENQERQFTYSPKPPMFFKKSQIKTGDRNIKQTYKTYPSKLQQMNLEIPLYTHVFESEIVNNICNRSAEKYGYAQLKVLHHHAYQNKAVAIIEVRIYNADKQLIAIYTGNGNIKMKSVKISKYTGFDKFNKMYLESFSHAMDDIKIQISKDSGQLNSLLNKSIK